MSDQADDEDPPLGASRRDWAVSAAKGLVGAIPLAGTLFSEIVGNVIPQQRIERLEDYVRRLDIRLKNIGDDAVKDRMSSAEAIDLFEDGAFQSARSLSDERREHIARLVAFGLAGTDKEMIEAKRLLKLLNGIDDDQIIILAGHLHKNRQDAVFNNTHKDILSPEQPHMNSDEETRERWTIAELARQQLGDLGLLKTRFARPAQGKPPDLDAETGMLRASGREVTPLGRLLLVRLGLAESKDF